MLRVGRVSALLINYYLPLGHAMSWHAHGRVACHLVWLLFVRQGCLDASAALDGDGCNSLVFSGALFPWFPVRRNTRNALTYVAYIKRRLRRESKPSGAITQAKLCMRVRCGAFAHAQLHSQRDCQHRTLS